MRTTARAWRTTLACLAVVMAAPPANAQVAGGIEVRSVDAAGSSLFDPEFLLSVGEVTDPDAHRDAATVLGSTEEWKVEERSLTIFDRVYVPRVVSGRGLDVGERVQFYRLVRRVRHPDNGAALGRLLVPTGVGRVEGIEDTVARVVVTTAFLPIQTGDFARRVVAGGAAGMREADRGAVSEGIVLTFQQDKAAHPTYDRMFLLDPSGRGLTAGQVVELFRPGADVDDRRMPDVHLGRAVVVRSGQGGAAAAVLTEVVRSDLVPGDRFRTLQ